MGEAMRLTFWGVRGSIPAPGPETVRYGGNTACVTVESDDRVLVIDAGSGIRVLGREVAGDDREFFVVFTHLHHDHLIGLPFFAPLYRADAHVHLLDYRHGIQSWSPAHLFDGIHVPMRPLRVADPPSGRAEDATTVLTRNGFAATSIALNHPGGGLGYRIDNGGRSFVHITDNELFAPEPRTTSFESFVDFCHGADVLSHDAQWTDADLPHRLGWGHSTAAHACQLAIAARVRRLILFHHDPDRDDDAIDAIEASARRILAPHGIECTAAFEGLRIELAALAETGPGGAT